MSGIRPCSGIKDTYMKSVCIADIILSVHLRKPAMSTWKSSLFANCKKTYLCRRRISLAPDDHLSSLTPEDTYIYSPDLAQQRDNLPLHPVPCRRSARTRTRTICISLLDFDSTCTIMTQGSIHRLQDIQRTTKGRSEHTLGRLRRVMKPAIESRRCLVQTLFRL